MIDQAELGLLSLANVTEDDLRRNRAIVESTGNHVGGSPSVITWFLPFVDHALKGGVRTVFMLAEKMTREFGTSSHFVIVGYGKDFPDCTVLANSLRTHFPDLKFTTQPFRTKFDDPGLLPASDCAICTLWTTAYVCARYQKTTAKFYLVQDYEPLFYPAGSISAVIEATYRFGFALLANTRGVAAKLGGFTNDVTQFCPGIDRQVFYPDKEKQAPSDPFRIVFYGRPQNDRNCFSLGIQILQNVKKQLGPSVEIVSVGAEWDEQDAGVDGVVKNLGLLPTMEEVATLYRESDLGLSFMATPHPSYQPFEYMASGCVVAMNINESTGWFLNRKNSLLVSPIPEIAADEINKLIRDNAEWEEKRNEALSAVASLSWSQALDTVASRIRS